MKIALAREHRKTLETVIAQARVTAESGAAKHSKPKRSKPLLLAHSACYAVAAIGFAAAIDPRTIFYK